MAEIDQVEAGPELNALVAVHVMGWTEQQLQLASIPHDREEALLWGWVDSTEENNPGNCEWRRAINLGPWPEQTYMLTPEEWNPSNLPRYSSNIFSAWEVLDKLDKGWRISIHQMWDGKAWQCSLEPAGGLTLDPEVPRGGVFANADTPALAICRAALKATNHGLLTNKLPA